MVRTQADLQFVRGDATVPVAEGPKIIAHVCNDLGAWGRGFVLALSRRWPDLPRDFKRWHKGRENNDFGLGSVQFIQVDNDVIVANMIAQHGLGIRRNIPPIRYDALESCLKKTAEKAISTGATVHMPRIGCGLAGGDWTQIEPLIVRMFSDRGVPVTVYDIE